MPRKTLPKSQEHYYHVTARSNNKEYFYLPLYEVWEIMLHHLKMLQADYDLKIISFVLMSNHFHLLILSPEIPIDKIMYFLMKKVTLEIQKRSHRINKIFGGRYKGCLIEDVSHLVNVYKYIYRNPVAANMCLHVEDYPYSTLQPLSHSLKLEKIDLSFLSTTDIKNFNEILWMNKSFSSIEQKSIRSGLRKTLFAYQKDTSSRKTIEPKF